MDELLSILVNRLSTMLRGTGVIPWGAPVPSFGDVQSSHLATLGLNPSNREFMDEDGSELVDQQRRFPTLGSLGLSTWSDTRAKHINMISDACRDYFSRNPYDGWFRRLDRLISGTGYSYYGSGGACHLDLVPYATEKKWTMLSPTQRKALINRTGDALGQLLRSSPVRMLVLNGRTVVDAFQQMTEVTLETRRVTAWDLPRRDGAGVAGIAFSGLVRSIHGIELKRNVHVFGYNHNIQSSFGVTSGVMGAISRWIGSRATKACS
jgi:hypothetical protein